MKPILFPAAAVLFSLISLLAPPASSAAEFDPAFTHVVYFWLKNPESAEDRKKFEEATRTFMKESKYAKTRFIGKPPKATRDVVDDSFTYSLILTFESAEAQDAYQSEPAHTQFVETCKDLWEKVIVYDAVPLDAE